MKKPVLSLKNRSMYLMTKICKNGLFLFLLLFMKNNTVEACNANFNTHNGCIGDTVFFEAQDLTGVYCWNFGDSTNVANVTHGQKAWHIYSKAGTYYVTLFVNIGAEYDYLTLPVTITATDCNKAKFDWSGYGGLISFSNLSFGKTDSCKWNFGEPSSGANNLGNGDQVSHQYAGFGAYTVTLISYFHNGKVDSTKNVINNYQHGATVINNHLDNCLQSNFYNVSYDSTSLSSINWNFGDPASGADNTSTLKNPAHTFSHAGVFKVCLIYSDGNHTDSIFVYRKVHDCDHVYPGDANNDGEVNVRDIFPIGIFNATQGTSRPNASTNFIPQISPSWNLGLMYLNDGFDLKFADCTGNGVVDKSDVEVISLNYGLKHTNENNEPSMQYVSAADPSLFLKYSTDTILSGDTAKVLINLGTQTIPANNIYGLSFSTTYDASMVKLAGTTVNYSKSWLGSNGVDLMNVSHNDTVNGILHIGMVLNDKQGVSGSGQIAEIDFIMKDDVSGFNSNHFFKTFHTSLNGNATVISNGMANNQQQVINVNLRNDTIVIKNVTTGIVPSYLPINSILAYPNPANDILNIEFNNNHVINLSLVNMMGQIIYSETPDALSKTQISLNNLPEGIYLLKLTTKEGSITKRICKSIKE